MKIEPEVIRINRILAALAVMGIPLAIYVMGILLRAEYTLISTTVFVLAGIWALIQVKDLMMWAFIEIEYREQKAHNED